jgi:hypothetical protein
MNYFMTDIMSLETCREVDHYVDKNSYDLPGGQKVKLHQFAHRRKEHIIRLQKQKKASYGIEMN